MCGNHLRLEGTQIMKPENEVLSGESGGRPEVSADDRCEER